MRGEGWISWLDGKQDGDLLTMAMMAIFPHPEHFQCPSLLPVAPLNFHTELIIINTHPTWNPTNAERGSMVPEGIDSLLDMLSLGLIYLNRSNLFGYI